MPDETRDRSRPSEHHILAGRALEPCVQAGTLSKLPQEIVAAYDAPFPDKRYKAGARVLPALVMSQQKTNQRAECLGRLRTMGETVLDGV